MTIMGKEKNRIDWELFTNRVMYLHENNVPTHTHVLQNCSVTRAKTGGLLVFSNVVMSSRDKQAFIMR